VRAGLIALVEARRHDTMAVGPPDPQLVLKVTPPRVPRTVLERPRLSSVRPEFADKAVIVLQAAAGSGKTSLLAQWRKEALQAGAVAAWLTLDSRDSDSRLVHGLAAAMRAGSGRQNFGQACARAAGLDDGSLDAVTEWLAEVADLAVETVLFLDDAHALPAATLDSSLAYLLLNAPANLRIILASRKPIALPIADLPARGRFAELTAADLRFDPAETVALLQARFGRRIELDSCARLHELTQGWPLGVQLAVSTIERSPDLQESIAAFSVRSGDLHRYFVECLVDHLPPAAAGFLVRVSFVDALSAALCEAITGQERCGEQLAQLRESTPIFSEGVDSDWSRIHPLAREFLMARFATLPEPERRMYHARAARWLQEHGQCEEAARQMFSAGLTDEACELIERSLHDVLLTGQVSLVADWIERLPQEEIRRRTNLRLTVGWMLAQSERHTEAAQLVGPIIEDASANAGDRCEAAEICATAALFADDIDSMGRIVASWYDVLPTHSMLRYLVGVNQLAYLTLCRGAPDQARFTYRQLPADDGAAGRYALGWRDWIVGISYLWEGQVDLAAQKLRVALAHAEEGSGRRSPIAVTLASALAVAQWERGESDDAAALLANRLDILERRAPPDAIIMGYVTASRVAAHTGGEQRALDLLDHLSALGEARRLPRLCIASASERMRLHASRGRGDACAVVERTLDALVAGLGDHQWGVRGPFVELQVGLARCYSAVARRNWKDALERLNALAPVAERLRRGRDAVQIYLLRAVATSRCGDDAAALLDEALSMCRMWGLARIVADTHPDLARLADASRGEAGAAPGARDAGAEAQSAGKARAGSATAARVRAGRGSLLSPREREVLQLLASSLSNKQIALAMGVSDETIKWHFKNLFRKLNAGSRSHLLHRARMVGVIDSVV
jgi:LuxR family maltose regulon positive regulatory protein